MPAAASAFFMWGAEGAESTETFAIMSAFPLSTLCLCVFASPAAK